MAHEMGHNLGMDHDHNACLCRSKSCIMSPVLSYALPTEFSSCSQQDFQSFTLTHTASCLRDVPSQDDIVAKPICGNHFVEIGEECDCGSPVECQNPCCDAQTCKLLEGVQCADGECCQECKFKAAGSLCRREKDDCDLQENCDGKSSQCPKDSFQLNGTPCKKDTGFCYNGKCPTLQEQCVSLWGRGSQPGSKACFNRNTVGDKFSYCKKTTYYQPCSPQDIMCGTLSCVGGTASPTFATATITLGTHVCRVILDQGGVNRGLVQNGMKCGDNKMCLNAKCAEVLVDDCFPKCPEDAACNHLQQCQFTDSRAHASSFPFFAIIITVVVAALLILVAGVFLYKKYIKKTALPRSQQLQTSGSTNPAFTESAPGTPQVTRAYNPKVPMKIAPPPPPFAMPSAPYPPAAAFPQVPSNKPTFPVPSGKPPALRTPPQMPAPKPMYPPAPKVMMPPTRPRY